MNTGVVAQPILSICIPTFNRAEYLKKSLDSLVCQEPIESEEIEIVISDNCSTDETNMIGMQYSKEFSNIKYFRNDTNYGIINGVKAISRGTGLLRKISNDIGEKYLIHRNLNSLLTLLLPLNVMATVIGTVSNTDMTFLAIRLLSKNSVTTKNKQYKTTSKNV